MNTQAGRAGKIQVELDRDQVRQLIGWLYLAAGAVEDLAARAAIVNQAVWLQHRYFRRWGGTDYDTQTKPATAKPGKTGQAKRRARNRAT